MESKYKKGSPGKRTVPGKHRTPTKKANQIKIITEANTPTLDNITPLNSKPVSVTKNAIKFPLADGKHPFNSGKKSSLRVAPQASEKVRIPKGVQYQTIEHASVTKKAAQDIEDSPSVLYLAASEVPGAGTI